LNQNIQIKKKKKKTCEYYSSKLTGWFNLTTIIINTIKINASKTLSGVERIETEKAEGDIPWLL
jgi:hypothetical protein